MIDRLRIALAVLQGRSVAYRVRFHAQQGVSGKDMLMIQCGTGGVWGPSNSWLIRVGSEPPETDSS